jgi:hypothetical protein
MPVMDNKPANDQFTTKPAGFDSAKSKLAALTTSQSPPTVAASASQNAGFWRGVKILAAVLICSVGVGTAIYILRPVGSNGQSGLQGVPPANPPADPHKPAAQFVGWTKAPDLAIVVSGQMHAYLNPCGCSDPQYGGLVRRYNFLQSLKQKGWPLLAVDVGEIAEGTGQGFGPQSQLKYEYSMKALKEMGYSVVGAGKTEFNMPLGQALGLFALNNPSPAVLATNLKDPKNEFEQLGLKKVKIVNVKPQLQIGFFSVVDTRVEKEVNDPNCKFAPAASELANVMLQNRANVSILIYHGNDSNGEVGKFITDLNALRARNKAIPEVPIILCLSSDAPPPARAKVIGSTTIVSVGHKGQYVGVIGLFQAPGNNGFGLKYELVSIGPNLDTPKNEIANQPIMKMLEKYTEDVEKRRFIEKFPRGAHPNQVEFNRMGIAKENTGYVGSDRCQNCHVNEYQVWKGTKHFVAFEKLTQATNPSRRQFDGECVVCHTVGFQHTGGYLSPGNPAAQNQLLQNVGCESCHGPGGAHINDKKNKEIHALMNPYSTTRRIPPGAIPANFVAQQSRRQDDFCQKCHDQENDVHWIKAPFNQTWQRISHPITPALVAVPQAGGAAAGPAPVIIDAPVIPVGPSNVAPTPPK